MFYYLAKSSKYRLPGNDFFTTEKELRENYPWVEDLTVEKVNKTDYLLSSVPEDFRSTLSYMAYERGHSAGEDEVTSILEGLVNDLRPAIMKFEQRLLGNI